MSKADLIKKLVKTKKESVMGKLGDSPYEDPMEPWSSKYNAPVKNEEVEQIEEGKMDHMSLSSLWHQHAKHSYGADQGYGGGVGGHHSHHAATAIENHVRKHHGNKVADDMVHHSDLHVAHAEYVGGKEAKKVERDAEKLRKKHKIEGGLYGMNEEVEEVNEDTWLFQYIRSLGYNPKIMGFAQRSKYARSNAFKHWKQSHMERRPGEIATMEDVQQVDETGTGMLMTFIKAKGLNPLSMDGNQKNKYSRSSEFRVFKQKHRKESVNETSGMGERGDDWNEETGGSLPKKKVKKAYKRLKEELDKADSVTMDIPLLIRVLEYAREDAKTDMDLHKVVENLIKMRDQGILSMYQYDAIVKITEDIQKIQELKRMPDNMDADDHITREDLRQWFSKTHPEGDWKRINSKGEVAGPCAREPGEPKPKCMSKEKRAKLSKKERAAAVAAKRRYDPVADRPGKGGKPINVSNFGKGKLSEEEVTEACWDTHKQVGMKKKGGKMVPDCVPKNEEVEQIDEKNSPTNPALWSRAKAMARSKFDVYPSAYANGWASKWYKSKGGGWKSVKEETVQEGIGSTEDSPLSATNSVKAMESAHRSKQMKSARMIKALYKNKIKETTYDWEKDDKPNAKIIVKGGTTMTGQPRDTVEIEPVLKTRPNQQKPTV